MDINNLLKHHIKYGTTHKWYYMNIIWLTMAPSRVPQVTLSPRELVFPIVSNVTGTVTKKFNRTTRALVPGSARDIAFKAMWRGNRLSNK